jgi:hypothetical protein
MGVHAGNVSNGNQAAQAGNVSNGNQAKELHMTHKLDEISSREYQ